MPNLERLKTFDPEEGTLNAVIETPKGCRNKFKYDPADSLFKLGGVLPAGHVFPFDFGFIPGTLGEDGDPLDVLVLMDEPAFAGCVVPSRLIGAICATQTERDGETNRNDRLIAVAETSHNLEKVREIGDLSPPLLREIEHFFVSFNHVKGKKFKVDDRVGSRAAVKLVRKGMRKRSRKRKRKR
jgi:inorganic pyrophosphatase